MEYIRRVLEIGKLLEESSLFLFGPRMTGKTAYIENELQKKAILSITFLDGDTLDAFRRNPVLLRSMLNGRTEGLVIVDEVQLFPPVLLDIQHIMTHSDIHFLLTGSSARKLKRSGSNLLGGRAGIVPMHPLVWKEIRDRNPDLDCIFATGMLPKAFTAKSYQTQLRNYVRGYLDNEIAAEGERRDLGVFSNFLTFAASENTELVNYTNVSRDIGMSADTIKGWYQILVDTFIGYYLRPYRKGSKRIPVNTSKFYFFDVGVARTAARMPVPSETMTEYGKMFENYIFMELKAYIDYRMTDDELYFWRTREGYEVDFVVENKVAIEVKTSKNISNRELRGIRAFRDENAVKDYIIVCRELFERTTEDGIRIMPWKVFLDKLWNNEIVSIAE